MQFGSRQSGCYGRQSRLVDNLTNTAFGKWNYLPIQALPSTQWECRPDFPNRPKKHRNYTPYRIPTV
jgi:hypothetical protein